RVDPPYEDIEPTRIYEVVEATPTDGILTMVVEGPDFDTGEKASTTILVPTGNRQEATKRLESAGLTVVVEDGLARIEEPFPGTPYFESIGKSFDYYVDEPVRVATIRKEKDRLPKEVFYIPALLVLGLVYLVQRRRKNAG
ncbi:MAG: DUF3394 domain-containing protein, partial [Gammaproteobacteria bacterium]|nr:DUF3394 domain-containing protein [Gammaproteobacteria bacterium]